MSGATPDPPEAGIVFKLTAEPLNYSTGGLDVPRVGSATQLSRRFGKAQVLP